METAAIDSSREWSGSVERQVIGSVAKLFCLAAWMGVMALAVVANASTPNQTRPLWPGQPPMVKGNSTADMRIVDFYLPATNPTHTGILVIPGGGYRYLASPEGTPVAEWLRARGIAAFVLRSRCAGYLAV
jgi:hypothetical protein